MGQRGTWANPGDPPVTQRGARRGLPLGRASWAHGAPRAPPLVWLPPHSFSLPRKLIAPKNF